MEINSYKLTEERLFKYPYLQKRTQMIALRIDELEQEKRADALSYIKTKKIKKPKDKNLMVVCENTSKLQAIELLKKELKMKKIELTEIELALSTLYEKEYTLVNLRYFKSAKMSEISEILGITREYASRLKKTTLKKISVVLFGS